MSIPIGKNESWPLIEIIEALGETEWRKGSSSEYVVKEQGKWILRQQDQYPPTVSFRFRQSNPDIVANLRRVVDGYSGKFKWSLNEYKCEPFLKVNFVIEPSCLWDVRERAESLGLTPKQYFAKYDPDFGSLAFKDLAGLTEHVRQALLGNSGKN